MANRLGMFAELGLQYVEKPGRSPDDDRSGGAFKDRVAQQGGEVFGSFGGKRFRHHWRDGGGGAGADQLSEFFGNIADADKSADEAEQQQQKEAEQLQKQIAQQIGGVAGKLAEGLTVTASEGGLLVSISDQSDDSMFNIGSAVPRQEMVLAMEKIGAILKERGGAVAIRGHTDGRQYKGTQNENWRLSMDRAQSAYYMLVRGGLDEKRISQVSGFADRRLKLPTDPFNATNRRIEILVQADKG